MRYIYTMENKQPTSFRLSSEAKALLADLATRLGISQASVLEMAIRELARRHRK